MWKPRPSQFTFPKCRGSTHGKYLLWKMSFHQALSSLKYLQIIFSLSDWLKRRLSRILSPFVFGECTIFQYIRWNFLQFVFPPSDRNFLRRMLILFKIPLGECSPEHWYNGSEQRIYFMRVIHPIWFNQWYPHKLIILTIFFMIPSHSFQI